MSPTLKYPIVYGAISGSIVTSVILAGMVFGKSSHLLNSELFGYLVMLVALTFIFVGVKRYRDNERGGVIRFWPAFGLGLATAAVAGICYVLVWEFYLASTDYVFMDGYIASLTRSYKAAGMTGAKLAAKVAELETMRAQYANPFFRLPMTFMEIFPVGLIVSLVSAALLCNPKVFPAR